MTAKMLLAILAVKIRKNLTYNSKSSLHHYNFDVNGVFKESTSVFTYIL